ncbi:MAG: guanine deaminase [Rhodospirillaceae bacterium]|jgi:guanine deaminase|nr:guanine deaminase [Rhodospirillaceae bacterium]
MSDLALSAIRGVALTFTGDPFSGPSESAMRYERDAILVMEDGLITEFGDAGALLPTLPDDIEVTTYPDSLILPGFIDCHVHYPQTQIIGAGGEALIDWLDKYTFVAEQAFAERDHASESAEVFCDELLRNGTTTASVFCTVHEHSADALFESAQSRNMRMIAGKALMDRNAPDALQDTAQSGYDESKRLINRWHDKDRLLYAITPRFAASSTPEQLELAGALWRENPGTYVQSHISETQQEIDWIQELYPERNGYFDVYDHYGLTGQRSIYGHGIHLTDDERQGFHETGTAIAHCPTSNQFLGSGLFDIGKAKESGRPVSVGLATDLGAGTSFSMLQTMGAAYQVARLAGADLTAAQALYLATTGAAKALCLEDKIGTLENGSEADLAIIDLKSTPIIDYRMRFADSLEETLFVLMTMGDDRAIRATYIAGDLAYQRD